jgi:hypothetical protein
VVEKVVAGTAVAFALISKRAAALEAVLAVSNTQWMGRVVHLLGSTRCNPMHKKKVCAILAHAHSKGRSFANPKRHTPTPSFFPEFFQKLDDFDLYPTSIL